MDDVFTVLLLVVVVLLLVLLLLLLLLLEVEVEGVLAAGLSNGMDIKNSSSSSLKKSE